MTTKRTPRTDAVGPWRVVLACVLAWAAVLTLPSCGGGVDSGGTGSAPATLAVGPITGFGSVVVGGVHYDESNAELRDGDGRSLQAGDLRLGMATRIDAGPIVQLNNRLESIAHAIHVDVRVRGRVDAVDAAAGTLTVLGQAVSTGSTTALDGLPGGLPAVRVGDVLAVYGDWDLSTGRIAATRVALASADDDFVLRGTVTALDLAGRTMTVAGQSVSLATLSSTDLPAALGVGLPVRVRLSPVAASGVWSATGLALESTVLPDRDRIEYEGRISAFVSAQQFSVDGIQVDASAASVSAQVAAALAIGVRVEVEGSASGGILRATSVEIEDEDDDEGGIELEGRIASIDPGTRSFVLRSITVIHNDDTTFEHGTVDQLAVGEEVSVKGTLAPDGTRLLARTIEFH